MKATVQAIKETKNGKYSIKIAVEHSNDLFTQTRTYFLFVDSHNMTEGQEFDIDLSDFDKEVREFYNDEGLKGSFTILQMK